jgi:peptidoglycan hydrolase-like protein with peptidoglycan-binding domain
MFYSPKHAAPRPSRLRRRLAGVAVTGAATLAGGAATAASSSAAPVVTHSPASSGGNVWDRVAACESGGNWSINTGNGFYGGLQFAFSTWKGFGGQRYAYTANQASRAEQIAVAQRVLQAQGPGAWPHCSKVAGLTRANGSTAGGGAVPAAASRSTARRAPAKPAAPAGALAVDGIRGPKTNAAIQRWVGVGADGSLSRTDVQALQRKVGATPDGIIGPKTTAALQTKIEAKRNGARYLDAATVRALQVYLNRQ